MFNYPQGSPLYQESRPQAEINQRYSHGRSALHDQSYSLRFQNTIRKGGLFRHYRVDGLH